MNRQEKRNRNFLLKQVLSYEPFNRQEEADRDIIIRKLQMVPDLFERSNLTEHMTASAWVVNAERTKVLMAYHNLYHSWAWLGGHADGEEDLLGTALREVSEESGIRHVRPVTEELFSLEILTVDGHIKAGMYVPSHLHLNVTYLIEADENEILSVKEDENSAVGWFEPSEAVSRSAEPWFAANIYMKLNRKLWQRLEQERKG